VLLSEGRTVGLRLIPMERDLRFSWEEMPQQMLDEQQQKVRDSLRTRAHRLGAQAGEGSDYTDNVPLQCLHPVGHWFEIPNLLRNGTLARLLEQRPNLKHLMLHNIDTVGADVDPAMLGLHITLGGGLSFEVITRRIEDRGGGLARVNGQPRIVEGLAMPREEEEFTLSYYNSMTSWINLDKLLAVFQLTRADLADAGKVAAAVRALAAKMPTYITLKDVKKRWGHGQEDVYPVAQFEKLWSDMTVLPEMNSRFIVVPRRRGQQLKDQSQLDGWLRDGSAALNVAGRNFGSSLVNADHRAGEFAVRQLRDVQGQTKFYAGLFDIQGSLPVPRQIVRAGVGVIFLRLDVRVLRRRGLRFGAFQGQRQRLPLPCVQLPVMTRSLSSTVPSNAPPIPPNSAFTVGAMVGDGRGFDVLPPWSRLLTHRPKGRHWSARRF
jgi:hypothetical protein